MHKHMISLCTVRNVRSQSLTREGRAMKQSIHTRTNNMVVYPESQAHLKLFWFDGSTQCPNVHASVQNINNFKSCNNLTELV